MSSAGGPHAERRRLMLLAPLMIAGNAFLFLCVAVLAIVGVNGGESLGVIPLGGDANRQVVREYLAERVPGYRYRICEWSPATPLEGNRSAAAGDLPDAVAGKGFAQRVKLVFYGPSGARELDTIYWIQNGRVTRTVAADRSRVPRGAFNGRGVL
jgi:hypothetical protein